MCVVQEDKSKKITVLYTESHSSKIRGTGRCQKLTSPHPDMVFYLLFASPARIFDRYLPSARSV